MEKEPKFKKVVEGADALSLGISVVVAVLMGVGIGYWMKKVLGYEWLLWLGIFWGVGGAALNIYKAYKRQKRELDELANDPKYKDYSSKKEEEDILDEFGK